MLPLKQVSIVVNMITKIMVCCLHVPDRILGFLDDRLERLQRRGFGDLPGAVVLLFPGLFILALFILIPMVSTFYMSLFGGRHGTGAFVGFNNYLDAFRSHDFRQSLLVTIYYVLGVIPISLVLSFFVAFGLYRIRKFRGLLRSFYFLPYVTSAVASALIWRSLFNPQSGVVNMILGFFGAAPQQWLLEPRGVLHILSGGAIPASWGPSLALVCIILFDIWHSCGFSIVVFLAGFSSLPPEIEEAARMDGAERWRLLRHITLPLLSPTLFFLLVVGVIKAFQAFNSFYALTQGENMADRQNLILYIYAQFYQYGYWGYASAVAVLLMLAIVALTFLQWRILESRIHYE